MQIFVNIYNRKNSIAKDFNGYIAIIEVMNFCKDLSIAKLFSVMFPGIFINIFPSASEFQYTPVCLYVRPSLSVLNTPKGYVDLSCSVKCWVPLNNARAFMKRFYYDSRMSGKTFKY